MVNWKKIFIFVGIPLLSFYIFLIVIFYAFIAGLFLIVLLLGFSCLRFSKKKIWAGLSKLSIAMILFLLLMISNPVYWPRQIVRHIDTSRVVQPNDPLVQGLNNTLAMWDYLNSTYGVNESVFYSLDNDSRLQLMTDYIIEDVIEYYYIPEVYGVIDYVSSAHEAIEKGRGDCHSRTIVMVSFFIYMGYNAYCCEAPFHWYTVVYFGPGRTDPHYYYRLNWTDPEIIFNHEEVFYPMNIFQRLGDIVFGLPFYDKIMELFSSRIVQILLAPILVGVGFLMTLGIKSTAWKSKKHYLKNAIFCSLILILGFLVAFGLSVFVPQITLLTMLITVAVAAQAVHSNLGARLSLSHEGTK
ncbi:MAG: hypothetical protein HWN66_14630 [Candidatus Helarchaeota archaeon]|nr:hypothetical protein [Candidatus Helarchaeota archaeon]